MKTLVYKLLIGVLALAATSARAQQRVLSEAPLTEQLPTGPAALSDVRNAAVLLQTGTGNTARIDQQSLSGLSNQAYVAQVGAANALGLVQDGSSNSASVVQNGTGNQADLTQKGQGNSSALTQQGDHNRLTGLVAGDHTELNIHQDGSNNQVDSEIRQDKRSFTISQYGSGNVLKQVESTTQATPGYSVEMRGTGINLTIEQGKIKP